MRIKTILLGTILPLTIGASIFVSYFFLSDRLPSHDTESCDDYTLANVDYLLALLIIVGLGTFYQLVIALPLKKKPIMNKAIGQVVNTMLFAVYFTALILAVTLVNGDVMEIGAIFLWMLALATICTVTISVWEIRISRANAEN